MGRRLPRRRRGTLHIVALKIVQPSRFEVGEAGEGRGHDQLERFDIGVMWTNGRNRQALI